MHDHFRRRLTNRRTALRAAASVIVLAAVGVSGAGERRASAQNATPGAGVAPAATPLGTTAPAASPEVLLTTTFPVALLPQGPAAVEFWHSTWEPGFQYLATEYHPTVSVGGDLVLSGAWGTRSDVPIVVWRNGRFENVPADQEAVLEPGEGVIYLDNAANEWIRNASDSTTVTANFAITLGDDFQGPNLGVDWEKSGLSGHDVVVALVRQTLAPGGALTVTPDLAAPAIHLVNDGTLRWAVLGPDGQESSPPLRFGPGETVPFALPANGGQILLSNAGDEPLVLLTMTMTAVDDSAATPVS